MDTANKTNAFKFNNFIQFQSDSNHLNTNALLRQGHMNVDGVRYKVSLASDDKILVSRDQQTQSKSKRFFKGAVDLFNHRLLDDASTSRSHRMTEALNYRRTTESRSQSAPPSQNVRQNTNPARTSQNSAHTRTATPRQQPTLDFDYFMQEEEKRADYANEVASPGLARAAYEDYLRNQQPKVKLRQSKSDPTPMRNTGPEYDLQYFIDEQTDTANYYSESPNIDLAQKKYQRHLASRQSASPSSNDFLRPRTAQRRAEENNSNPMDYETELALAKQKLESAEYYGYSADLTQWEKRLLETESSRPAPTQNARPIRHNSAPPVLQNTSSHKANRFEQQTAQPLRDPAGQVPNSRQIHSTIRRQIRNLPAGQNAVPANTMALFEQVTPRLTEKSKKEVLSHMQGFMNLPASRRDKKLAELQIVLNNLQSGGA